MKKLNPKQTLFCQEYILDLNATKAAIRAGYSKKTARTIASKLLTNIDIVNFIKELQIPKVEDLEITAEFILKGIKDIAMNGEKQGDQLKAYDLLGKYQGIYEKDNRQKETKVSVFGDMYKDG